MSHRALFSSILFISLAACGKSSKQDTTAAPVATSTPPPAETAPAEDFSATTTAQASCPIDLAGTSVAFEPTADGGALVFTTDADAEAMRTRVSSLAEQHSQEHAAHGAVATQPAEPSADPTDQSEVGTGQQVGNSLGRGTGTEGSTGVEDPSEGYPEEDTTLAGGRPARAGEPSLEIETASTVRVEDGIDGVRLVFTPAGDADAARLQQELQEEATRLTTACAD